MKFFIKNTDTKDTLLVQGLPTEESKSAYLQSFIEDSSPAKHPKFREVLRPGEHTTVEIPKEYIIGIEIL